VTVAGGIACVCAVSIKGEEGENETQKQTKNMKSGDWAASNSDGSSSSKGQRHGNNTYKMGVRASERVFAVRDGNVRFLFVKTEKKVLRGPVASPMTMDGEPRRRERLMFERWSVFGFWFKYVLQRAYDANAMQ